MVDVLPGPGVVGPLAAEFCTYWSLSRALLKTPHGTAVSYPDGRG